MRPIRLLLAAALVVALSACPEPTPEPDPDPVDGDGDGVSEDEDCDDTDPANFPGNEEVCDGADNDCDGEVGSDEQDDDGDTVTECDGDCDDTEPAAFPDNPEICDTIDNDCDPATDEAVDGDGDTISVCDGDCDDDDGSRAPALDEICDGVDNDCDDGTLFTSENTFEHAPVGSQAWPLDEGTVVGNVYMVAYDLEITGLAVHVATTASATFTAVVYSRETFDDPWELAADAPVDGVGGTLDWTASDTLEVTLTGGLQWLVGLHVNGAYTASEDDAPTQPGWGRFLYTQVRTDAGDDAPDAFADGYGTGDPLSIRLTTRDQDESDTDGDGFVGCLDDCDDTNEDASPDGTEVACDLADNDCDPSTIDCVGGLIVSEIFNNAFGDDADREWFEILNTTAEDLDLLGFTIRDDGDDAFLVHTSTVVPAGSRVVLADSSDFSANGGIIPDFEFYFLGLSNSEDELVLVSALGEVVDAVAWDSDAGFPGQEGASLNLDPTAENSGDNDLGASWCVSTGGPYGLGEEVGTPGEANGSCVLAQSGAVAGDVIFTEIMQNPDYVTDAHGEWFEVYNTSGSDIDLRGWTFSDSGSDAFVITGPLVLAADDRLVLADNVDLSINGSIPVDFRYGGNMTLGNGADQIILVTPAGLEIDRVEYDGGTDFPDPAGRSTSLSPGSHSGTANDIGINWCEATNDRTPFDYATPGAENDVCI